MPYRSRAVQMAGDAIEQANQVEHEIHQLNEMLADAHTRLKQACETVKIRINYVIRNEPEAFEAEPWLAHWAVCALPEQGFRVDKHEAIHQAVFGQESVCAAILSTQTSPASS